MSWQNEDDERLTDMVFMTNSSVSDIAAELARDEWDVRKRMKDLGIDWVKNTNGYASAGQASLTHIIRKLIPGEEVVTEHPLGERLRLDVYCPAYKLAAEYHGRQHFEFVEHFHRDAQGFRASKQRDDRKFEICREQGIVLVAFRYCDKLEEGVVFDRLLHALRDAPSITKKEVSESKYKGNPFYEKQMERQRKFRREQYRRMKALRGRSG